MPVRRRAKGTCARKARKAGQNRTARSNAAHAPFRVEQARSHLAHAHQDGAIMLPLKPLPSWLFVL